MSENKVQIVVEVDAKTGQATIRQIGEEMEAAGKKGASGFGRASAEADRVRQAISKANPVSQQLGAEMDTAGKKGARGFGEASAATDRLRQSMAPAVGLAQQLGLAFGAYEMVQGSKWAIQTADNMLALDNRMLLSARNTADYVAAQETVVGVAKQTHQELGAVGQFYTRLAIATKDLNIEQRDLADVTRGVNIAVALSGSATQEATAGVQQFSQAMSLGRLQGDEFRSMMENIPMVAMAVIDGLGLTVAEFREQSEQGLITTERMIEAVKNQLPELEAQAKAMPVMVGMAMNDLRTSASLYTEEVNEAIGMSASLAGAISWLGENLDTVAKGGTMALAGALAVLTGRGIAAVVAAMPEMIAGMRAYATVTETATVMTNAYSMATETTSRVSLGAAATRLMTMPNIIGAVTTALTLGATAWALWGDHASDAADKAKAELDQLRRYNTMMKELSDPEIKLREAEAQRAAARARVEELAAAGHKHVNALGQVIVTGEYGEAEKALKVYEEKYTLVQENMSLAAKQRAVKEVAAAMSIADFEKKMAGERMVASATGLQKDLLDIAKRKDEAIAAARTRFKDTTEFARAEAAINSRYAGEEAKAREAAGKKARDEGVRTRNEYVKTRAEYEKKTDLAGLEGIQKELKEIGQEAAGLAAKYGSQDWIDTWQAEAEQAAIAKDHLKEQKDELEKLSKVRDAYHQAMIASLPEEQQAVARVTDEYRKQQIAVLDALNAGEISADEAWARSAALSRRETEATRKALDNLRSKGDEMTKIWDRAHENMQNITGDWLEGLDVSLSSVGSMFKKMLAQMVNAWLWGQAQMKWAGPAGAMGAAGSQAAGQGGGIGGGISSLFSPTAMSGSLAGMALGGLSGISSLAYNIGLDSVGNLAFDAANWMSGLSSGLADGLTAGVGSLAISLLSGQGLTVQSGMQAAGAALGSFILPGIGTILGGMAGNFLGGLFGKGGGASVGGSAWSTGEAYLPAGHTSHQSDADMRTAAAGLASTINRLTAELGGTAANLQTMIGFSTDPQGDSPSAVMGGVRDAAGKQLYLAGHQDVGRTPEALSAALDLEGKRVILAALQAMDLNAFVDPILDNLNLKTISADAADQALAFVESADQIIAAFGSLGVSAAGLASGVFDADKAASLVSGDVWAVLADSAQQAVRDGLAQSAAAFTSGDLAAGQSRLEGIVTAVSQISSALAPLQEIVDTAGMSDRELALRQLELKWNQLTAGLTAAGVDVSKLTILEEALGIERSRIIASTDDLTDAERDLANARQTIEQRIRAQEISNMERAGDAAGALAAIRADEISATEASLQPLLQRLYALEDEAEVTGRAAENLKDAEAGLRRAHAAAADGFRQTIDQYTRFAGEMRRFRDSLLLGDLSTFTPEQKYAEATRQIDTLAARVQLNDAEAMEQWGGAAQEFLTLSRDYNASSEAYTSDVNRILSVTEAAAAGATRTVGIAQEQLTRLDEQVGALITINESVLSVREAIAALGIAQAAASAAAARPSGGGGSSSVPVASAANNAGLAINAADSAMTAAAKVLYQSATGGVNTSLYNRYVGAVGGAGAIAGWNGDPASLRKIYGFADGGVHQGGLRLVGERGPELEVTGPSRIYDADATRQMLSGGSSQPIVDAIQQLRAEVGNLRRETAAANAEANRLRAELVKATAGTTDAVAGLETSIELSAAARKVA